MYIFIVPLVIKMFWVRINYNNNTNGTWQRQVSYVGLAWPLSNLWYNWSWNPTEKTEDDVVSMEQRVSGFNHIWKRTQTLSVGSSHSKYETLKFGAPQGSVLGPILFSIYNSPIGEIIEKHNICYHLYADDGQLYLTFSPKDSLSHEEAREKMMKCAKDIKSFLTFNKM